MKPYAAICLNGPHFQNPMLSRVLNTMFSNGDEPLSITPEVSLVQKEAISQSTSEHPPLASLPTKARDWKELNTLCSKPNFSEGVWTIQQGLPSWQQAPSLPVSQEHFGNGPIRKMGSGKIGVRIYIRWLGNHPSYQEAVSGPEVSGTNIKPQRGYQECQTRVEQRPLFQLSTFLSEAHCVADKSHLYSACPEINAVHEAKSF